MQRSCRDLMVELGSVVGDLHDERFVVEYPPNSAGEGYTPDTQRFKTEIRAFR